jgi:ferredoxin
MTEFPVNITTGGRLEYKKPEGKINRRQLLGMVLPRYCELPVIKSERCLGAKCGLCAVNCPVGAVTVSDNTAVIDNDECRGCGTCLAVCPAGAVVFAGGDNDMLVAMIRNLVAARGEGTAIALNCRECLPEGVVIPENISVLPLPCLSAVTPLLLLEALMAGAGSVTVIAGYDCQAGVDAARWQRAVSFVKKLLEAWGENPARVNPVVCRDAATDIFNKATAAFGAIKFPEVKDPPEITGDRLGYIIDEINRERKSTAVLSGDDIPFGTVALARDKCSGCGLCADNCPTGAISQQSSDGSVSLVFRHRDCIACGQCVAICPEKCLEIKPELDLAGLAVPPVTVFQSGIVFCRYCGQPVASRAMIEQVRQRLLAAGITGTAQLEICPDCKVKAGLGAGRNRSGSV